MVGPLLVILSQDVVFTPPCRCVNLTVAILRASVDFTDPAYSTDSISTVFTSDSANSAKSSYAD